MTWIGKIGQTRIVKFHEIPWKAFELEKMCTILSLGRNSKEHDTLKKWLMVNSANWLKVMRSQVPIVVMMMGSSDEIGRTQEMTAVVHYFWLVNHNEWSKWWDLKLPLTLYCSVWEGFISFFLFIVGQESNIWFTMWQIPKHHEI